MRKTVADKALTCPCDSQKTYSNCCGPLHEGKPAANAEGLIRSRYTAFMFGLENYLSATWHSSTRPTLVNYKTEPQPTWLGLNVKEHKSTGDNTATVEFVARYRVKEQEQIIHELSSFICEDGKWYYVDGLFLEK
jgi:SEC-C motif-containing protein